MASQDYRYYCLDRTGKLHDAERLRAHSDEDAVAQIQAKHPGTKCVIWQDRRMVAKIGFDAANEVIALSLGTAARSYSLLRETSWMLADDHSRGDA